MTDHQTDLPGDSEQKPDFLTSQSEVQTLSEQTMTPNFHELQLVAQVRGCDSSRFTTGYHWTVRLKVAEMDDRKATILLSVLCIEQLSSGMSFTGYLSMEHLTAWLLKGKLDPLELRDERIRKTVMVATLLLASVRGTWQNLEEKVRLSPAVIDSVAKTGWLPNYRTYQSWKQYYQPQRFLEVLAVPLDTYIENRDTSTIRYSGYCKGYGNGGHISRTKKTPYDYELDGETTDREPPSFSLLEINQYNQLLLSIEKEKLARLYERD